MSITPEDVRRRVEEDIRRSGYPTELNIHTALNSHRYVVHANDYYLDHDENKSRSIDLAVKAMEITAGNLTDALPIHVTMAIECKKSDNNAWVIFENNSFVAIRKSGQISDYRQILTRNYDEDSILWDYDKEMNFHYGKEFGMPPIGISYTVTSKGKADKDPPKDEIFEAVNQVLKYISFEFEKERLTRYQGNTEFKSYHPLVLVFYPVIVFDGYLYRGKLRNDDVSLYDAEHIVLQYKFRSQHPRNSKDYYIDIVTKNYFKSYLETIIEPEIKKIVDLVGRNQSIILADANKLKNYIGSYAISKLE